MAVAVKTSPGARSSGTSGGLVLYSLVGVVYLIATLAIVFEFLPYLWWRAWESLGGGQVTFVGSTLLAMLELVAAAGLLWGGVRLLGRSPTAGVRAGVFVGFAGILAILLLTRWAGSIFEGYVFVSRSLTAQTGAMLTAGVGVLLLALGIYGFTRPWTQAWLVKLEEGGWFHATVYKGNQGRLVRRGTIVGILLLVGTGVWSLMQSGTFHRTSTDWALTIPFTGKNAVASMGDARDFVRDEQFVPASAKTQVQIKWVGDDKSKVRVDQVVTVDQYKKLVNEALDRAKVQTEQKLAQAEKQVEKNKEKPDLTTLDRLAKETSRLNGELKAIAKTKEQIDEAATKDPVDYLYAVNHAVWDEFQRVVPKPDQNDPSAIFHQGIRQQLYETSKQTTWDDMTRLFVAVKKEADLAKKTEEVGWMLSIPAAILLVDRAALQKANDEVEKHVYVGYKSNTAFALDEGSRVTKSDFDKEETRLMVALASKGDRLGGPNKSDQDALETLKTATNGKEFTKKLDELILDANQPTKGKLERLRTDVTTPGLVPRAIPLAWATGEVLYEKVPLLPAVQFTVPLLLLAMGTWIGWRAVNLPAFADFLIATEAEMNKVSWTTQKRLVQDTLVVLVTVVLMAGFLFSMDVLWKQVLSWERIGVIHVPEDKSNTKKSITDKKW